MYVTEIQNKNVALNDIQTPVWYLRESSLKIQD